MTTSQPSNASERQLYNVLKRANLLQYYDTFIAQGINNFSNSQTDFFSWLAELGIGQSKQKRGKNFLF